VSDKRPRWWRADEIEQQAWREFVWLLFQRDHLNEAIDRHLGQTSEGVDEVLYQSVCADVKRRRDALVEAEADRYGTPDRARHDEVVGRLTERLGKAEAERVRLEGLRVDRERAEALREKWLHVADTYVSFDGIDKPSRDEMHAVYLDLDVSFEIGTKIMARWYPPLLAAGEIDTDHFVHGSSWLSCQGFRLPSVSTADRSVRPCP
jgi:hypothetical protein